MYKKILLGILIYFVCIFNASALNVSEGYFGYPVCTRGVINPPKFLKNENREYLFRLKDENLDYSKFKGYNEFTGTLDEDLFNRINNIIKAGYIDHDRKDYYYILTQIIIFREYYNTSDIYVCDSNKNVWPGSEEAINEILNSIKLDKIDNKVIKVYDNLELDNKYKYYLDDFNNKELGNYTIKYGIDSNYNYYYDGLGNYIFNSSSNGYMYKSFDVSVTGVKIEVDDYYKDFLIYDGDILLGSLKDIKYLKNNHRYVIKNNDYIEYIDTLDNDIVLNKVIDSNIELVSNEDNIILEDNPKTSDNIIVTSIIFISISVIYVILYIKFRKNC